MPDTKRKQILDGIQAALAAHADISVATQTVDTWVADNPQEYPKVLILGRLFNGARLAYPHDTAEDMQAELEIAIMGRTYSNLQTEVNGDLDALEQDIEQTLLALVTPAEDLVKIESESDVSTDQHVGFYRAVYMARYSYNHGTP